MRTPKSSTQKQSRKRREGKSALAEFDGAKPIADERLGRAPFLGPSCHYACGLDSGGCYCGQHSNRTSFLAPVRELGNAYAGGAVSWLPLVCADCTISVFTAVRLKVEQNQLVRIID